MEYRKNTRGAVNRLVLILLVLIVVMLVIIAVPAVKAFRFTAGRIACEQAMKSAGDGLIIEYLGRFQEGSTQDARETIEEVMPARENICPSHGNVYLIRNSQGIFEPVCGLHCRDAALRTRLNASYARNQLIEERKKMVSDPEGEPETVRIIVNGKELTCVRVTEEEMIHRGTATTNGYDGIVAFYGIAGDFSFSAKTASKGMGAVKEGEICYFVYADEEHCAIWRSNDGWDGDAYDQP